MTVLLVAAMAYGASIATFAEYVFYTDCFCWWDVVARLAPVLLTGAFVCIFGRRVWVRI